MGSHVKGRRVAVTGDFEKPGDYCVVYNDAKEITALWFSIPVCGQWGRIQAEASPEVGPKWTITEEADDSITVSPSILSQWTWGEERIEVRFHGYLKAGVWELLGDCQNLEAAKR